MRAIIFALLTLLSFGSSASQLKAGVFPALSYNGEASTLFRLDTVFLLGGDSFSFGPYVGLHAQSPQTDIIYGGAIHIGNEYYAELQAGILKRTFTQASGDTLTGNGVAGNLIFGVSLSSHLGVDVVLSGKRISDGTLDQRTIYNLLPMFTIRGEL